MVGAIVPLDTRGQPLSFVSAARADELRCGLCALGGAGGRAVWARAGVLEQTSHRKSDGAVAGPARSRGDESGFGAGMAGDGWRKGGGWLSFLSFSFLVWNSTLALGFCRPAVVGFPNIIPASGIGYLLSFLTSIRSFVVCCCSPRQALGNERYIQYIT